MIGLSVYNADAQQYQSYKCTTLKTYKQALKYYETKQETKLTPGKDKYTWLDEYGHELTKFTISKNDNVEHLVDLTDMDKGNPMRTRYSPATNAYNKVPKIKMGHVHHTQLLEACGKVKNLKKNSKSITDRFNNLFLDSEGNITKEYASMISSTYAFVFLCAYINTFQRQRRLYQDNSAAFSALSIAINENKQKIIDYSKVNTKAKNDYIKRMQEITRGEGYIRGKTATARKAFLYLYNINDTHLGYGITVDIQMRDKTHQKTFEDYGHKGRLIYLFEGTGKEIEQVEHNMKQSLELASLPLEGFRTESTSLNALEEVLTKFTKNLNMRNL